MEKKKRLNRASSVLCLIPPGNSRQQNPGGPPYKKDCASKPC